MLRSLHEVGYPIHLPRDASDINGVASSKKPLDVLNKRVFSLFQWLLGSASSAVPGSFCTGPGERFVPILVGKQEEPPSKHMVLLTGTTTKLAVKSDCHARMVRKERDFNFSNFKIIHGELHGHKSILKSFRLFDVSGSSEITEMDLSLPTPKA